jgi:hypothetical protein
MTGCGLRCAMIKREHLVCDSGGSSWIRLLFGDTPWLMLSVLLTCGLITYSLTQEAVFAILAVVLAGLTAHDWLMRRTETASEDEEYP